MVVYEADEKKDEQGELIKLNLDKNEYFTNLNKKLQWVENKLLSIVPELNFDIYFHNRCNSVATHGNGAGYLNSKIRIMTPGHNYISNFSVSCFPNCCGMGIVTANYDCLSSYTKDNFNGIEFTLKLIPYVASLYKYPTLILTTLDTQFYSEYLDIRGYLEKNNWKCVNKTKRKTGEGNILTYMLTDIEQDKSLKELENFLNNIK